MKTNGRESHASCSHFFLTPLRYPLLSSTAPPAATPNQVFYLKPSSIPRATVLSHPVYSHAGTHPHITNIFQVSKKAKSNPGELSIGACFGGHGMGA